ncbi:protein of unknown function [Streptomyces sp. KY75]|nr:protein of unknown function [Streptomyces sp. KY75]CAD5975277.1 protein of unknown function [Streptomyces sp. KY70]
MSLHCSLCDTQLPRQLPVAQSRTQQEKDFLLPARQLLEPSDPTHWSDSGSPVRASRICCFGPLRHTGPS